MRILTLFIILLGSSYLYGNDEVYVWVDENGVTNYSQQSPKDRNAQRLGGGPQVEEPAPAGRPGGSRPGAVPAAEEETTAATNSAVNTATPSTSDERSGADIDPDALVATERAALEAKIKETKKSNCDIGKRNLAKLEAYSRIRVQDGDSERMLSDEERQERIDGARNIIRENCSG